MLMSWKKTVVAFALIFVLTAATNFLIHAILLQGVYQQNAGLMRTPQDGAAHAPFLLVAFFFFSVAFVWLYPASKAGVSWVRQGLRYGIAVWLIVTVSRYFIYYAIQPWPFSTVLLQLAYELVATLLMGEVLAFVAKNQ
jgi:hypothetical protein